MLKNTLIIPITYIVFYLYKPVYYKNIIYYFRIRVVGIGGKVQSCLAFSSIFVVVCVYVTGIYA